MSKQNGGKKKVRYAVVGLGHISQVAMLPAFAHADNSELTAMVSGDETKRDALSRKYGVAHAVGYDGYDALLEAGVVDAVYIAVPNHLHRDYTERAARHGVHVLCEKPMAPSEADCRAMIQACEKADVRLMIAYRLHFDAANLEVMELARGGALGELRYFESAFSQDVKEGDIRLAPIEKGGGSVYDVGVYCINAARYVFRSEPVEVSAVSARGDDPRWKDCDEMTSATLKFPGDRLATFTSSFGAAGVSQYRVVGVTGQANMNPAYGYADELAYEAEVDGEQREKTFPKRDQFGPQLVYFSDCVLKGRRPEPDGWEGLADVRVVEAIYESARTGRRVQLAPVGQPQRPTGDQAISRPGIEKPKEVHASGPSK